MVKKVDKERCVRSWCENWKNGTIMEIMQVLVKKNDDADDGELSRSFLRGR